MDEPGKATTAFSTFNWVDHGDGASSNAPHFASSIAPHLAPANYSGTQLLHFYQRSEIEDTAGVPNSPDANPALEISVDHEEFADITMMLVEQDDVYASLTKHTNVELECCCHVMAALNYHRVMYD